MTEWSFRPKRFYAAVHGDQDTDRDKCESASEEKYLNGGIALKREMLDQRVHGNEHTGTDQHQDDAEPDPIARPRSFRRIRLIFHHNPRSARDAVCAVNPARSIPQKGRSNATHRNVI